MTLNELIKEVSDSITASCSLPYKPPDKEIKRIILLEMRWLYREYRELLQDRIYVLNKKWYDTAAWRETRTYQLNDCTEGLKQVVEMTGGNRIFGINDPDMNFDRLMAADMYLTPLSSDQITYRTIQWSFWDLARAFNLRDINHSFRANTHRLVITGRDPEESLFILAMDHIPLEDAYEDPVVIKWMIAKSKISLAKILGTFNYQLLGNITINYDMWRQEGNEELVELKTLINDNNVPDWFLMFPVWIPAIITTGFSLLQNIIPFIQNFI